MLPWSYRPLVGVVKTRRGAVGCRLPPRRWCNRKVSSGFPRPAARLARCDGGEGGLHLVGAFRDGAELPFQVGDAVAHLGAVVLMDDAFLACLLRDPLDLGLGSVELLGALVDETDEVNG